MKYLESMANALNVDYEKFIAVSKACGILKKEEYLNNKVCVSDRQALDDFVSHAGPLTAGERNTLAFMSYFSRMMPLSGFNGLKARTQLLESMYDAE